VAIVLNRPNRQNFCDPDNSQITFASFAANQMMAPITRMIIMNLGSNCLWGVMALWSAKKVPSATMPRTNNPTFAFWFIAPTGI
jgi:hypothetical protein